MSDFLSLTFGSQVIQPLVLGVMPFILSLILQILIPSRNPVSARQANDCEMKIRGDVIEE